MKRNSNSKKSKRDMVLGKKSPVKGRIFLFAASAAAVTAVAVLIFGGTGNQLPGSSEDRQVKGDTVKLPLKIFEDGRARHFSFNEGGREIRYFIVKSSDGETRAAFDACDVCWKSNKGYSQEGEFMVCNNCGRRFHTSLINEVKGGCNPSPLKRTVEGDNLVIQRKDIVKGMKYFALQGR